MAHFRTEISSLFTRPEISWLVSVTNQLRAVLVATAPRLKGKGHFARQFALLEAASNHTAPAAIQTTNENDAPSKPFYYTLFVILNPDIGLFGQGYFILGKKQGLDFCLFFLNESPF